MLSIVMVLVVAFSSSVLHELEHDIIHNLFFKKNLAAQNIILYCIWFVKLHGNPWMRRDLHLKHHIVSGQLNDAEERLIGLGQYAGFTRLIMSIHPFAQIFVLQTLRKEAPWLNIEQLTHTSAIAGGLFFVLTSLCGFNILAMIALGNKYNDCILASHWW